MKPFLKIALVAGGVALSLYGCIFSPSIDDPPPPRAVYASPTAPESVVVNLVVSYSRREIEQYAKILAPEFIFKFQPTDVQELGLEKDFWTRDQDSTGTANLFRTNLVSAIRIELIHGVSTPTNDLSFPPGTMQIRIDQTNLEVDQSDGVTWIVTDQQDMFFRRGLASASEDTTHWFLIEWRDLELGGAAPQPPLGSLSEDVGMSQTHHTSWGELLEGRKGSTP